MASRQERHVLAFLGRVDQTLAKRRLTRRESARLFDEFLAVADLPTPEPRLIRWFADPAVIVSLASTLHIPYSDETRELLGRVRSYQRQDRRSSFYRVRELTALGDYPNLEFAAQRGWYVIRHGRPDGSRSS